MDLKVSEAANKLIALLNSNKEWCGDLSYVYQIAAIKSVASTMENSMNARTIAIMVANSIKGR